MAKSILEGAMEDAKLLKKTAFESAKNVLVEAFSDDIKHFVNNQLNESTFTEMPEVLRSLNPEELEKLLMLVKQQSDGGNEFGFGGETDNEEFGMMGMDDEEEEASLESSGMYESDANAVVPPVTETKEEDEEEETMEENQEMVEITSEDLKRAFSEVVKANLSEAEVTPGFGDVENPNSNAVGGLGEKNAPGERGVEDKEKEEMWKDHEPPASEDWTVAEQVYKRKIEMLNKQIGNLKSENVELREACQFLQKNIQEANLFNQKLIYTQKLVQETNNLTRPQREKIVESIDRAESLREVELIYKSLSESLKIAGVLGESKQRAGKVAKNSRFIGSGSTMLKETLARETGEDAWAVEQQKLAGLLG